MKLPGLDRIRHTSYSARNAIIAVGMAVLVIAAGVTFAIVASKPRLNSLASIGAAKRSVVSTTTSSPFAAYKSSAGPLYSSAIVSENNRPGTSDWRITGNQTPTNIEGYASKVSVDQGHSFTLFVSTTSDSYVVQAYRMGYYQGLLGRLIWTSKNIAGIQQASCPVVAPSNTVECNWKPSLTILTNSNWIPGDYLLKLVGDNGAQKWVPITVRNDRSNAAVVIVNAVTTWQAYNLYGRYDLYSGPSGYSDRATKVSFDRPYDYYFGQGAADFYGNELPLVSLVEKMGLNVTYITDVDIEKSPGLLSNHRVLVSLGHDEYYSPEMRNALTSAQQNGTNLMFLGANAIYRRIRFESTKLGPDRIEVNYRSAALDPMNAVNKALVTTNWPDPPDPEPEGALIGIQYACNPVRYDMVITDPSSWIFANSGLKFGSRLRNLVGSEYDGFNPYDPYPKDLQILAHSPVLCRNQPGFSDMSYYTTQQGAGVFATGTNLWVAALGSSCPPFMGSCPMAPVVQITENVLKNFGSGLPGLNNPSHSNALQTWRNPPIPAMHPIPTTTTTLANSKSTTTTTLANSKSTTTTTLANSKSTTTTSGINGTTTSTTTPKSSHLLQ
ncbi:MAG: hypothetical protein EPN30_08270 [Actinomycetota bacterium]|nr:MAG: hypothetical protein EPN30_08270 [Actinomycetota bacterium]